MPLQSLQALTHPDGNRIDLSWQFDAASVIDGLRIVRAQGRYPHHPEDGVIVADTSVENQVSDMGLQAEQVYYYSVFPFTGDPPVYEFDATNRATALTTAPNGYAEYMLSLLPAIYHRYDKDTQFLARFLQIIGGQLDQFHSLANFSRSLRKLDKMPGTMLPLLAQWIGWNTDYKRDLNNQRDEIKNAPEIYRRVELLPTVEATIKRISNWESRSKEYVHNIFSSNRPPRLNLWAMTRNGGGAWSADETLQSLDYCYEGRPSYANDVNDIRWLFYHTQRKGRWEIWSKATPSIFLDLSLSSELNNGPMSIDLWQAFSDAGLSLAQTAVLNNIDTRIWQVIDGLQLFIIERSDTQITVYDQTTDTMSFGASQANISNSLINKYPTAAMQGNVLWLCWSTYDSESEQWQLALRRRENAQWSASGPEPADTAVLNPFLEAGIFDAMRPRRRAYIVNDDANGIWLFWQEYNGSRWQLRYNYHDGSIWGEPVTLPLDGADDPKVQDDIMVVVSAGAPNPRIYLFWARQQAIASADGVRWQLALRVKTDQVLDAGNWSIVHNLSKGAVDNYHDREPYALLNSSNELEVFWASNRDYSGWSIWRSTLLDYATDSWSAAERITGSVYHQRAPFVLRLGDVFGLFYRSNRKRIYSSEIYRASETHDERYAGSITTDIRHQEQIQLRDQFDDPQRYTYDTGTNGQRDDSNRIARDTIGAFLQTTTLDETEIDNGVERLRQVAREFIPITDRAVFITDKIVHSEHVYSYELPPAAESRYISSTYTDEWISSTEASALAPGEDFTAILES